MPDTDSPSTDLSPALGGQQPALGDAPALGTGAMLAHLLEAIEDNDPAIQQRAAEALGEVGGEKAISRLMTLLSDHHTDLRALAARGLGRARSVDAVDALLLALEDPSDKVRWSAAEALGRIGHEGAVNSLLVALKDRDQVVRERAAEALGGIAETLGPGPLRDAIPGALLDVLRISSTIFFARLSNIISRSLLQVGDSAVPTLIAALLQEEGRLSETAAEMLAFHSIRTRDQAVRRQIAEALVKGAASAETFIARTAIRALGIAAASLIQGDDLSLAQQVAHGLIALCRDVDATDPDVEEQVITLRVGSWRLAAMQVPPRSAAYVRPDAVQTLGRIGVEHPDLASEVLPQLIHSLYDDDMGLRRAAVEALARIAEPYPKAIHAAIPALAGRLHDDAGRPFSREPRISDLATALLRRLATPEATAALQQSGR